MVQLLLCVCVTTTLCWSLVGSTAAAQQLSNGFQATPNPTVSSFQALITDSVGNYSMGFLRVNQTQLALAVIHAPSSVTTWLANMTGSPRWSDHTQLIFNGSLVVSDSVSGVLWSTRTTGGDRVWLSDTSNLQIQASDGSVLWQSFDYPSDTLVEGQNFTSNMSLVSANGIYSMRLGWNFIGLYAKFKSGSDPGQIYLKHKALQAKANIIPGKPIYAVIKSDGFLGMYQDGTTAPVDVQSFTSYQLNASGVRRVRMETDGNLEGYFWTGSRWISDYQAISDTCDLPSTCGPYGLCQRGKGCSCLNNQTESDSGRCVSPGNHNLVDFCSVYGSKYKSLRDNGVDLPYKELMEYQKMDNYQQCESACQQNCTCWGVVYRNTSGFCYIIDYPIQSLVTVADESRMGFFKVSDGVGKSKMDVGLGVGVGAACVAVVVFGGLVCFGWYRYRCKTKRGVSGYGKEDGMAGVGPYKDLGAASFKSIELSSGS